MSATPGPWKDGGCFSTLAGRRRNISIQTADEKVVADVRTEEDARLIAAAPELLKLAEIAVRVAMRRPHDGSQLDEDLEGLLLEARAAIRKARGES